VEARLALGQHAELTAWLEELVAQYPLRERLWGALMLALYRSGRQADALAAFGRVRALLVEELGAEPTPALRAIHELVLRQADAPQTVVTGVVAPASPARDTAVRHASIKASAARSRPAPARLTSFVGRTRQVAELTTLLTTQRLVTLTGPAGAGKTRLALELLDRADAGWLVEFAGVAEPGRTGSTVAMVLRLREQPGVDLLDVVADHLAEAQGLLVLDNCEHLVDAVARLVSTVLGAAPGIRVLATSRQSLGVAGEVVYDVPPLATPDSDDLAAVEGSDAATLLVQRARAATTRFVLDASNAAAVARIVRRLDGLPLAVELAAARLRVFDAARLADLLDDRFRVLVSPVRHAPARHQTLLAAVASSYDALDPPERAVFCDLSVFEGGFTLDAAERINGSAIALLPTLVDRSLVVVDARPAGVRYRLLETLREYGRAQLEPEDAEQVRLRHLGWAVDLTETMVAQVRGPDYASALELLDAERDNLWAALRWSLRQGRPEQALRLVTALAFYWDERACLDEGLAVLREALAIGGDLPAPLRSAAYASGALLAMDKADHAAATDLARRSLALAQECGHQPTQWRAQELLGMSALYQGDYDEALRLLTECRDEYARLGLDSDRACVIGRLGHLHRLRGDYPAARTDLEECLAVRERIGDVSGRAWVVWQLGILARYEGGPLDRADALYRRGLAEFAALGDVGGIAHVRYSMGDLARLAGDHAAAARLYEQSLAVLRAHGDRRCVASILYNLGVLALSEKDSRAGEHLRRSLAMRRELNDQAGVAESLEAVALVAEREGDALDAVRRLGEAAGIRARTGAMSPADEDHSRHELIEGLRVAVEPGAFAQAWAEGFRAGGLLHQSTGPDQPAGPAPAGPAGLEPDRNRWLR
jgi:predicted ATPase